MLNANCCGLCGKVIAPRELFSHLVVEHGWKRADGAKAKPVKEPKTQKNVPVIKLVVNQPVVAWASLLPECWINQDLLKAFERQALELLEQKIKDEFDGLQSSESPSTVQLIKLKTLAAAWGNAAQEKTKEVSPNREQSDSELSDYPEHWPVMPAQYKNCKVVTLKMLGDWWLIRSKSGQRIAALQSETEALSWLDYHAKVRGIDFQVKQDAPAEVMKTVVQTKVLTNRKVTRSKRARVNTSPSFTGNQYTFCKVCGGDGGAGGRCWKCDGTGWAK